MKKVKTDANWFGAPQVIVHGSKRDPIPCVGEVVMLTGGVKARIQKMSVISSKLDAFRSDNIWSAEALLDFAV